MATFFGFSTAQADNVRSLQLGSGVDGGSGSLNSSVRVGKKFRVVDQDLVLLDFINSLNIPQGQKVGNPGYGTTLWNFIFEPNTLDIQFQLEDDAGNRTK